MTNPEDLLKEYANRLARRALSGNEMGTLSLFQIGGLVGTAAANAGPSTFAGNAAVGSQAGAAGHDQLGIWERKKGAPYFVRRLDMFNEWYLWANLGRIEPKSTKKRVLLMGESVARGYLYDPQFTPAMALEHMLGPYFKTGDVEIVDLARTDQGLGLGKLAVAAADLLNPDAVVIFAGNNWGPEGRALPAFSRGDIPFLDSAVRQGGIAGIKQWTERLLDRSVGQVVREIASAYESRKIPLLWIIPEFNLGDWRDPVQNAPYLPGDRNPEWIVCNDKGTAALAAGDVEAASDFARKMIALDGGVSVAGFYLLADCGLRKGDIDAARHCLERARDAVIWDPSIGAYAPRPYSIAQNILREEAPKFKQDVLDLPVCFREYLSGQLPDRRLFLDYCHMTTEGINVAMAATASWILKALNRPAATPQSLATQAVSPGSRIEAEAAFLAAVHNAHWHQSCELIHFHCKKALDLAPEIASLMLKFADVQSRRIPVLLCEAAKEIAEMQWPSTERYVFYGKPQQLDKNLVEAMLDALKSHGVDGCEEMARIRREEHSIAVRATNLLDYYYCAPSVQPQETLWVNPVFSTYKKSNYYRAYWRESRFFFVGEAGSPVHLCLTCRLPDASEKTVTVEVNGGFQAEIAATNKWSTWNIVIPASVSISGLNQVTVRWPTPRFSLEEAVKTITEDIPHKLVPEFYCSFGEIHAFTASGGQCDNQRFAAATASADAAEQAPGARVQSMT
ncbi:MAG: hypothetical protein LAP21_04585 [Acidobacteriia bacterium]|nr:hypothetical protein [Terriglobia bacterium]